MRGIVKAVNPTRIPHSRALHHLSQRPSSSSLLHSRSAPLLGTSECHPRRLLLSATYASSGSSLLSSSHQNDPSKYNEQDPQHDHDIADQEWELRTGRAIYLIQETLPSFFQTGLCTVVDKATGEPRPPHSSSLSSASSGASSASGGGFHVPLLDPLLPTPTSVQGEFDSAAETVEKMEEREEGEEERVYCSNVRLEYTPPVILPSPFPRVFRVEGLHLYLTCASLIRHAMNAVYKDLELTIVKVSVHTVPPPRSDAPGDGGTLACSGATTSSGSTSTSTRGSPSAPSSSTPTPTIIQLKGQAQSTSQGVHPPPADAHLVSQLRRAQGTQHFKLEHARKDGMKKRTVNREKYLVVRQVVAGTNRVSGGVSEWEIESTYTFSPTSGLILRHAINWIHPAPHFGVYESLRGGLGKVFGFGSAAGAGVGVGVGGVGCASEGPR